MQRRCVTSSVVFIWWHKWLCHHSTLHRIFQLKWYSISYKKMVSMYSNIRFFFFKLYRCLLFNRFVSIIRISKCSHAQVSQKTYGLTSTIWLKVDLFPKKSQTTKTYLKLYHLNLVLNGCQSIGYSTEYIIKCNDITLWKTFWICHICTCHSSL